MLAAPIQRVEGMVLGSTGTPPREVYVVLLGTHGHRTQPAPHQLRRCFEILDGDVVDIVEWRQSAMELMGDAGYLRGHFVEKAYRDARLTQIYEGTNQINRLAVVEDHVEELLRMVQGGANGIL
jgi:hypothetical protein